MRAHQSLFAALLLIGCAGTQPPRALIEADSQLSSPRAEQLEASRPKLLRQAHDAQGAARAALDRGDAEAAELHAQQAVQYFATADAMDGRDATYAQINAMDRAVDEIKGEADRAAADTGALRKLRAAEGRFRTLEAARMARFARASRL